MDTSPVPDTSGKRLNCPRPGCELTFGDFDAICAHFAEPLSPCGDWLAYRELHGYQGVFACHKISKYDLTVSFQMKALQMETQLRMKMSYRPSLPTAHSH